MSKERKNSVLKNFIKFMLFMIFLTIIVLIAWKLYGIKDINKSAFERINTFKKETKSIFDSYYVETTKANRNLYYVTLHDVYSKAASIGEDPVQHYFKVSIVFQTDSKNNVTKIKEIIDLTVGEIRLQLKNYPVTNVEFTEIMKYIKKDLKYKMNKKIGEESVQEVYFNTFLAQ